MADPIIDKTTLNYQFAKQHQLLCDTQTDPSRVIVYHTDALSPESLSEVKRISQKPVRLNLLSDTEFSELLTKSYHASSADDLEFAASISDELDLNSMVHALPETQDLLDNQDDAPIIRLINAIFSEAIRDDASDIHIETFEHDVLVRIRTDGVLKEILRLERALSPLVISRIKVMAKLDIAEKRLPQDGRLSLNLGGRVIDVRVSTIPSNHGERLVMRILDNTSSRLRLADMEMIQNSFDKIQQLIKSPHGIILVTGPTGSGKTTSLYAMLSELNSTERNILTIEDPIEYDLPGIGQTQVNSKIGMSFAKGLRAILRQDPDIVMIGEIRDLETAEIAIQSSLTGHLVLSTLHTNTAIGAITRLQDMGIAPFLLSSSILGIIAQRLVRKLCQHCRKVMPITDQIAEQLRLKNYEGLNIYEPQGCPECQQSGYKGRIGLYEVVVVNEELRRLIHKEAGEDAYTNAVKADLMPIRHYGIRLVINGLTSLEEVMRVTNQKL